MDFGPTESQREIARLAGQLLDEGKADPWKELARAGLLGLSLPAELGGAGLGVLDTAVLLTEIGRRAAPVPALATLMTGVLPVVRWGDDGLKRALLPPVAAGELILTAAIREPSDPMPGNPAVTVTDGTVSGTKVGVPYCAEAARALLPVSFAEGGTGVVIVDPAADGATVTRTPSDNQPEYTLRLDGVAVGHVLGAAATASQTCTSWRWRARAAWRTAPCPAALALTRDHVATRRQFGKPLADLPGGRPADRRRLHRVAHAPPGHPVSVLAA